MDRKTIGRGGRLALSLLFANLLLLNGFLAYQYWGARDRAMPEFNADKIQLLAQPKTPTRASELAVAPPVDSPLALCYKIGNMDQTRYQLFRDVMAKLDLDARHLRLIAENSLPWWVYWPPEYETAQREAVVKKFALAGVKEVVPIAKGAMAQSFSLGLHPDEARARTARDELRGKGLDKAEYGIRPAIGTFRMQLFPEDAGRQQALKTLLPGWAELLDAKACAQ